MAFPVWSEVKSPDSELDYGADWEDWLGSDTIATSTWTCSSDKITLANGTVVDKKTYVWIAGGTDGESYEVKNSITTNGGREVSRTLKLKVKIR